MRTFAAFVACLLCVALASNGNLRAKPVEAAKEDASTEDLNTATAELAADDESTAVESTEEGSSDDSEEGVQTGSDESEEASSDQSEEAGSDDSEKDSVDNSEDASRTMIDDEDESEEGDDDWLTAAEKREVMEAEDVGDDEETPTPAEAVAAADSEDGEATPAEDDEETPAPVVMDESDDTVDQEEEDASSLVQTAAKPEAKEAATKAAGKDAKVPEIQYDNKKFEKDWHNEWKNGDHPGYKDTYSKDTFPGRKAVVAAEDIQSDGKPGVAGFSGPHVGAYLKHSKDGTIER